MELSHPDMEVKNNQITNWKKSFTTWNEKHSSLNLIFKKIMGPTVFGVW